MIKRLLSMMIIASAGMMTLTGCDNSADNSNGTDSVDSIDSSDKNSKKLLTVRIINIRLRLIAKMYAIMRNILN